MSSFGYWQLGSLHKIESEDCYSSGATGVIQASIALWPEYPERLEIHGTKGSAGRRGGSANHLVTLELPPRYRPKLHLAHRILLLLLRSPPSLLNASFSTSERRARQGGPRPVRVEMDFVLSRLSVVSTRRVLKGTKFT